MTIPNIFCIFVIIFGQIMKISKELKLKGYISRITISPDIQELPEIYNQLTNEIIGCISILDNLNLKTINSFNSLNKIEYTLNISNNPNLTQITGFYNLTEIGSWFAINNNLNLTHITGFNSLTIMNDDVFIGNNPNLTHITGFNSLTEIKGSLHILGGNSKLISMSIPYTLFNSQILGEYPKNFINGQHRIQECIDKYDPSIYPDIVVKQIIENLELWGEPETINTIINHLLDKAPHLANVIPIEFLNIYHTPTIKRNNRIIKKIFV